MPPTMPATAAYHNSSLDNAFDIGLVPDELHSDDPFDQTEAYLAAIAWYQDSREDAIRKFRNTHCVDIDLGVMERMYQDDNTSAAIQTLQGRRRIVYGPRHIIDADCKTMFWDTDKSYLDMLVCVGQGLGLAPVIPALDTHHNFSFKMDLKDSHRIFTAKHITLGFDPVGSMMRIGKTGSGEDTWLAFVPHEHMDNIQENELEPNSSQNQATTTCLSVAQQRRTKMFIAHCLKHMHYRDITVLDPYPDVMDKKYGKASNIFDRYLDLNLQDLKSLDRAIISQYSTWVVDAPDSYTEDNFFQSKYPICVTSCFGQNHSLVLNLNQEKITWDTDREWSRIRYVNVALATHIRVNKVDGWDGLDFDQLVEAYPDGLFDSPDVASRNQLSHTQIREILDADKKGNLPHVSGNCVYSNRGYIVDTHDPVYHGSPHAYGALVKADKLQHAFAPLSPLPAVMDEQADNSPVYDQTTATRFYFYPQAGLRRVGHFQAKGLMSACYPIVARINDRLRIGNRIIPPHSHIGMDITNYGANVIQPISSQGYNAIVHHTRGRTAQHHDAQLGIVTTALAGQWAITGSSSVQRGEKFLDDCQIEMPHQAFQRKIEHADLPRDLRLENVYCIDLMALPPSRRYGSVIIEEIIMPLLRIWDHATTRSVIETHVQLFRPSAFPALYLWTTFPLTAFLDCIFTKGASLYPRKKFKHAMIVELCSVVERALNYMHTGNAAVIASSVMTPLWIGKALIADGLPCLNPDIVVIITSTRFEVSAQNWPMGKELSRPLSSSMATQLFRFDRKHFNRFYAHLAMAVIVSKPPPPFASETDETQSRSLSLMAYCVALFIDDCKNLITQKVQKDIHRQTRSRDPQPQYAQLRKLSLEKWKKETHPLGYGDDEGSTYAYLLSSISENPQGDPPEGVQVEESLTYIGLAKHIIKTAQSGSRISAPLWKHGSFLTALQIAMPEICSICAVSEPESTGVLEDILATTMRTLNIHFVPWHGPSQSARGTRHAVSYIHWMCIDQANSLNNLVASGRTEIQQAAADHVANAKWSPWNVPEKLLEMKGLWDKTVLPMQWSIQSASLGTYENKESHQYVATVYKWAGKNYDRSNWRHHMALVWAILLTAILPNLCIPEGTKSIQPGASASEVNDTIRTWAWTAPTKGRKGVQARAPFITMVTTYIMAILDHTSPLLEYVAKHNKLGNPWTSKHGMKYLHALNLIRMQIMEAKSASVLGHARFRENFDVVAEAQLKKQYDQIIGYLEDEEYGVYFAICDIFGKEMADSAVKNGHTKRPILNVENGHDESRDSEEDVDDMEY